MKWECYYPSVPSNDVEPHWKTITKKWYYEIIPIFDETGWRYDFRASALQPPAQVGTSANWEYGQLHGSFMTLREAFAAADKNEA